MKEKKITKTIFETLDGKQFDKKDDAKQHETDLVINNFSEKEIALMLKDICIERTSCVGCPFYEGNDKCAIAYTPDSWTF
jgi:hypothetical protein